MGGWGGVSSVGGWGGVISVLIFFPLKLSQHPYFWYTKYIQYSSTAVIMLNFKNRLMEPFLNMNNLKSSISHLEDSYQSCKLRNFFQKFNTKRQIKVLDWGRWKRSNIQLSISDSWILRRIAPLNTETLFHIYIKVENSSNYFENLFCCETIR